MNPEQPQAQAIAIAGTTIVALGTQEQILGLAIDGTIRLDLEGRTVYPGFIDSHSHWIGDRHVGGYETAEAVLAYAISLGWTSINELFVDQARLDELLALDAAGLLPMRVNAYLPINFTDDKFGEWYLEHPPGTDLSPHVRIAGIKLFMDHGWGENIHWTQSELNEYVLHAHENGYQVAAHTVGHDSLDMLLNAQAHALEMVPDLDPRFRIEHAIQVRDDQLQPLLDGGTIASIQLPGPADWPDDDLYQERMADDPLTWLMRWQDFLGFGIPTIGSTDWPWMTPEGYFDIPLTPFLATYMAVTRDGYFKLPVEPYQQAQTLTVEQSLLLLTINGAYGTFEEDRKGSLEPGKFADLVVISADPLTIPVDDLPAIEVLLTMVGGEVVYDTGLFSEE
jgi:predicted amidohydrolase YtcJ